MRMATLLLRQHQEIPEEMYLGIEREFGYETGQKRVINNPEEMDIFLDNMALAVKTAESMKLMSTAIDIFVTFEVTTDMAGLVLQYAETPVRILVQIDKNSPRFEHWGYY
jgi:hypothetical protein